MSVPGANLLALALTVQTPQEVGFRQWVANTTNAVGKDVPSYAEQVSVWGSFQPMSRERVEFFGLEAGKSYAVFYATGAFQAVQRNGAPDRFAYAGRLYEVVDNTDWSAQDGWSGLLLVDVGPDVGQ